MMFDSYRKNTLSFRPEFCFNCGRCTEVCPHGVFAAGERHVELVRPEVCMECGACSKNCPVQAISVQSGVGCTWAMIGAALRGKDMDCSVYGCGGGEGSCCSGGSREEEPCCGGEQ